MTLSHPFSALDVAKVFMLNVYKLHGLPKAIVSDRDRIFTGTLWEQLFIRCFVHATPSKWSEWLHLAKFWYNCSYHSSIDKSPFEVLYRYPLHILALERMLAIFQIWICGYLKGN